MNLKQKLSKKLKKTGGFTLIEMLIVVAIIAILVAVSIPMVGNSLDKARTATDDANERAAKGAALAAYMLNENSTAFTATGSGATAKVECYYDAVNGDVQADTTGIEPYNQIEETATGSGTPNIPIGEGCVKVTIMTATGETTTEWVDIVTAPDP